MLRKAVPAVEASKPASTKTPKLAVVSSILIPTVAATGATAAIAVSNLLKSNADEVNDLAITSTTLCVSSASKPNPLRVAAATLADCARSEPVAVASSNVASAASKISSVVKPSLAYSSSNCATSVAVN